MGKVLEIPRVEELLREAVALGLVEAIEQPDGSTKYRLTEHGLARMNNAIDRPSN